ncbi:hypothetical protein GCM10027168_33830 [Streptomyces capparidis]
MHFASRQSTAPNRPSAPALTWVLAYSGDVVSNLAQPLSATSRLTHPATAAATLARTAGPFPRFPRIALPSSRGERAEAGPYRARRTAAPVDGLHGKWRRSPCGRPDNRLCAGPPPNDKRTLGQSYTQRVHEECHSRRGQPS